MDRLSADRFLALFDGVTLREKLRRIRRGLREPHESGDYKYAIAELRHLISWSSAVVVPLLVVLAILLVPPPRRAVAQYPPVRVPPEPEPERKLKDPDPVKKPPPDPPPDRTLQSAIDNLHSSIPPPPSAAPGISEDTKPLSAPPLAQIRSPLRLPLPFKETGLGRRRQLIDGVRGEPSETAVLRALRWLKANQLDDGSWGDVKPAMTGLALLCFLGHGEVPGESQEFGPTVRRGIQWLLRNQETSGRFRGRDGNDYSLPIATYALCEAFAMTGVPDVRRAAERGVRLIMQGQNPGGGWNYRCVPAERNDTSYMGWCAQALKGAYMAGIRPPGIETAMTRAVAGFKHNAHPQGGFGYTAPGRTGLTGVGVLCCQFLGAENDDAVRQGLAILDNTTCSWSEPQGKRPLYYWYYVTQARYHAAGDTWTRWERSYERELVRNQVVLDEESAAQAVGYWESPSPSEKHGRVYSTALCALMLEVKYRYLQLYDTKTALLPAEAPPPTPGLDIKIVFGEDA